MIKTLILSGIDDFFSIPMGVMRTVMRLRCKILFITALEDELCRLRDQGLIPNLQIIEVTHIITPIGNREKLRISNFQVMHPRPIAHRERYNTLFDWQEVTDWDQSNE